MSVVKIFVCYSHVDKVWVEAEQPHGLMPWLQRQLKRHKVEIWWDTGIHAGDDFKELIFEKIDEAQIAILLFSNNIAGSDFILDIELPRIRQRYEEKKLAILPILISPLSDLTRELLDWVLDIQMVPNSRKGLTSSVGTSEWPEVQTNVLNEIYRRVNLLRMSEPALHVAPAGSGTTQVGPDAEGDQPHKFTGELGGAGTDSIQYGSPELEEEVVPERVSIHPAAVAAPEVFKSSPPPLPTARPQTATPLSQGRPTPPSRKSVRSRHLWIYSIIGVVFVGFVYGVFFTGSKGSTANDSGTRRGSVAEGKSFKNSLGIEMIWVNPGTFQMGSPEDESERDTDETRHKVTLTQGYWLAKTELTQGQWKSVMGNNPSEYTSSGLDAPVESITWDEAMDYCRRLTDLERAEGAIPTGWKYSLPTEAQWEYACRAGSETAYSFGDDPADLHRYGNYDNDGYQYTAPVASYPPNQWGFHDMHGNVLEWCRDAMDPNKADYGDADVIDPLGSIGTHRVYRGGGFVSPAGNCRSAFRFASSPSLRSFNLGFRPALVPP